MTGNYALHTDLYAITMLASALQTGTAHRKSTFSVFTRQLPQGRGYGVVGGTHRAITQVRNFAFTEEQLDYLKSDPTLCKLPNLEDLIQYLREYKFTGTIEGLLEGDVFFENTPIMYISGTFGECIVLEALILSIMNHDSAIASAAARMRDASREGTKLIEMGTRRTHEDAAIDSARLSWMVGFDGTSNVEATRQYPDITLIGTTAHAFILLYDSELEAFQAQAEALGEDTTYLVDTYDITEGIKNAVKASNGKLSGVRIDSGDPHKETIKARALLDELGAPHAGIILSGDMDEYSLEKYAQDPIDTFGVGTKLVTGSGHPTAGMVYKLVERENTQGVMEPVAKASAGKATIPGYMPLLRAYDIYDGQISVEMLAQPDVVPALLEDGYDVAHRNLLDTDIVAEDPNLALRHARELHANRMARLPDSAKGNNVDVRKNGIFHRRAIARNEQE